MTIIFFLLGFFIGSLIPVYSSLVIMLKNKLVGYAPRKSGGVKPNGGYFND